MKTLGPVLRTFRVSIGQRFWIEHYGVSGESAPFFWNAAFRLSGPLNVVAFLDAVRWIVEQQDTLRTTFQFQNGRFLQAVHACAGDVVEVIDLPHLSEAGRELQACDLAGFLDQRTVDIASGPLFRSRLIHIAAEEHVFAAWASEAVCDGASRTLLLSQIMDRYRCIVGGEVFAATTSENSARRPQYGDFAVWQAERMVLPDVRRQRDYWRQQLECFHEYELALPGNRRLPERSFECGQFELYLDASCRDGLAVLAAQRRATLFIILLAASCAASKAWSRRSYVVIGSTADYRGKAEFEGIIGLFTCSLRFGVELADDPPFVEVVDRCRAAATEAFCNQDFPLELAIEEMDPARDLYKYPAFAVKLVLQQATLLWAGLPDVKVAPFGPNRSKARHDLTIGLLDSGRAINGVVSYDKERLPRADVEIMMSNWTSFVHLAAKRPSLKISELIEHAAAVPISC